MPARSGPVSADNVAIPFKLRRNDEVLSFISTTMVFGTPVDITLSELALETFFPADEATAASVYTPPGPGRAERRGRVGLANVLNHDSVGHGPHERSEQ
jgi:hypothetical protein